MNGWKQDLRFALRQLRRAPGFAATAVLTLALGIGANTAIFTLFHQVMLRSLPVQAPKELMRLEFTGTDRGRASSFGGGRGDYFSYPMYRDLRDKNTVFSGLLANDEVQVGAVWQNQPELIAGELVSGNYFDVLGVRPALGRLLLASDDRVKGGSPVVVLSYDYWKTHFDGSSDILQKTLLINGSPFAIVGVAQQGFHSAIGEYRPKIFVPLMMKVQVTPGWDDLDARRSVWLNVVGRLKPGLTADSAAQTITGLWKNLRTEELSAMTGTSPRFRDAFLKNSVLLLRDNSKGFSPLRSNLQTPLLILMGMVALLAVMTCANLAGLLLVRAAGRTKEIAVRYALGAQRGRILRQLMMEGILLGVLGGAAGMALAPVAVGLLLRNLFGATGTDTFSTHPEMPVLFFNIALSLIISLLFSAAPAWQLLKPQMNDALRQQAANNLGAAQRVRQAAVAIQICLSVLLLSGAGLFLRSLDKLKTQDLGLKTDHLLAFSINPTMAGYADKDSLGVLQRIRREAATLPGVQSAAATTDPELAGNGQTANFTPQGYAMKEGEFTDAEIPWITPGYFTTLGIPFLAGHDITDADTSSSAKVAIINATLANKYYGSPQKALGHYIAMGGGNSIKMDTQIIGIVANAKHKGLKDDLESMFYRPATQSVSKDSSDVTGMTFYVRTLQDPQLAENDIRAALRRIDSKLVIDTMRTMAEQIDDNISSERTLALLAASFAFVALITTAVGLYGVLAFATAQRTREIGIRMALGAQRWQVVRIVLLDTALLTGIGLCVGLPASIALSRLLRSQLFDISPFDPLTLMACVLLTTLVVMLAAAIPARRAASVDPIKALRIE